jgi:hypothetical protein
MGIFRPNIGGLSILVDSIEIEYFQKLSKVRDIRDAENVTQTLQRGFIKTRSPESPCSLFAYLA